MSHALDRAVAGVRIDWRPGENERASPLRSRAATVAEDHHP